MLAILGLLGLAVAGTAFVALPGPEAGDDDSAPEPIDPADDAWGGDLLAGVTPLSGLEPALAENEAVTSPMTDGYDEFFGGEEDDFVDGLGGADYLDGRGGNDTLLGGADDDQIFGGRGDDLVAGDDGDDLLLGHIGDDDMIGGLGDDVLQGGDGRDAMAGGDGDDTLLGGWGDDTLIGGSGNDNLQGSEGNDIIDGVTGEAFPERDYLNGSDGNDTLIGSNGDVMSGGADADRFEITGGLVEIMDYAPDDLLVLNYSGDAPALSTEPGPNGLTLLANGEPVASLFGVTTFDVSNVQLVAM